MKQEILNASCELGPGSDIGPYHVITDPPYSDKVHSNAVSSSKSRGFRKRNLGFDALTPALRASVLHWCKGASGWTAIFSDVEGAHLWRDGIEAPARYIRTCPWFRWAAPVPSNDRPPHIFEEIILAHGPGSLSYNGPKGLDRDLYFHIYEERCLRGEDKHKSEKPLDLALRLVAYLTEPGELVVDPCAGRGTFGLACRLLGRRYLGFEIDPAECALAQERLCADLSKRDAERVRRFEAK